MDEEDDDELDEFLSRTERTTLLPEEFPLRFTVELLPEEVVEELLLEVFFELLRLTLEPLLELLELLRFTVDELEFDDELLVRFT